MLLRAGVLGISGWSRSCVHPPVFQQRIYDAGWRNTGLKKKLLWNFWPLILRVYYSLFIVVWPAIIFLYIKNRLLANLCFRTEEGVISLLTGKCPLSSQLRWPWGFRGGPHAYRSHGGSARPHYHMNLSRNLVEIFWENLCSETLEITVLETAPGGTQSLLCLGRCTYWALLWDLRVPA